jgi:hypothetical protein
MPASRLGSYVISTCRRERNVSAPNTNRHSLVQKRAPGKPDESADGTALSGDDCVAVSRPHHTISAVGLINGGQVSIPEEESLAHHGVLFLDKLPEFKRHVLERPRQPLEDGSTSIQSRAALISWLEPRSEGASKTSIAELAPHSLDHVSFSGISLSVGDLGAHRAAVGGTYATTIIIAYRGIRRL